MFRREVLFAMSSENASEGRLKESFGFKFKGIIIAGLKL
jgi:hypothetical protein